MADYNEAIKNLQTIQGMPLTIRLATEALEKQIPKKPIAVYCKGLMWTGDCPSCGQKQSYGTKDWHKWFNKFCFDCGQALDWGDE